MLETKRIVARSIADSVRQAFSRANAEIRRNAEMLRMISSMAGVSMRPCVLKEDGERRLVVGTCFEFRDEETYRYTVELLGGGSGGGGA